MKQFIMKVHIDKSINKSGEYSKKTEAKKIIRVKNVLPKNEKLRKAKRPSNVLLLNPKKHQTASLKSKIIHVFVGTFYEYAAITKVNGMYYLRQFVTRGWLRFLWSCIMVGLLSFAATLIFLLYGRYLTSPTRVTIAPAMPISTIPFPAVTICHPQNVMEYKSKEFLKKA